MPQIDPKFGLILTIVLIALALLVGALAPVNGNLPDGFTRTVLAAEFVQDQGQVAQVYQQGEEFGARMKRSLIADYAFLIAYGLLFAYLARGPLGCWAILLALGAAGFDALENWGMWQATDNPAFTAARIYVPATAKWFLLGVLWIVIGRLFLLPKASWHWGWDLSFFAALLVSRAGPVFGFDWLWTWGAFLVPLGYFLLHLRYVLVEGSIDTEVDAVRTGLGTAYLAAGTITVFSTWFSHSRLEVASPLLAAALLLQAGYFWIRYLSTPTR